MQLKVQYLENYNKEWGELFSTEGNSGYDLRAAISEPITLKPGERKVIPCGIKVQLEPQNQESESFTYELQVRPRSGLAAKKGITIVNTPGTIDFNYRGEIMCILKNTNESSQVRYTNRTGSIGYNQWNIIPNESDDDSLVINPGDRIAQLVICPVMKATIIPVESVEDTDRGSKGLGSSGVQ